MVIKPVITIFEQATGTLFIPAKDNRKQKGQGRNPGLKLTY